MIKIEFTQEQEDKLKEVLIVDRNFGGFIRAYLTSQKCGIHFKYGIKLNICSDVTNKTEESFNTEHKIIILLNILAP